MPSIEELQPLLVEPREDLGVEYKTWLDLTNTTNKAKIAKASIALANHGGGFIVIGYDDNVENLVAVDRPADIPDITQDLINSAIRRYASPEFHCELYSVPHPDSDQTHPVISVPGTLTVPVMSSRDCQGEIVKFRCYIRKPGPRSEEPQTGDEWRGLLDRCVRSGREEMLEAIRSILSGRVDFQDAPQSAAEELQIFCDSARSRWHDLVSDEPEDSPARFPHGSYEMGFALLGAEPASGLAELQDRLAEAHRIRLTGWTPFLNLNRTEWAPYPFDDLIEAWVGREIHEDRAFRDAAHSDFWRASQDGHLYTSRGYGEDGLDQYEPGTVLDITLPVWRVGEAVLFAHRLSETFDNVDGLAIRCKYTGLRGRRLESVTGRRILHIDRICQTDEIILTAEVSVSQVQDNLVEVMHQLLAPLYERFNFFSLPLSLVEEELERMRSGRF